MAALHCLPLTRPTARTCLISVFCDEPQQKYEKDFKYFVQLQISCCCLAQQNGRILFLFMHKMLREDRDLDTGPGEAVLGEVRQPGLRWGDLNMTNCPHSCLQQGGQKAGRRRAAQHLRGHGADEEGHDDLTECGEAPVWWRWFSVGERGWREARKIGLKIITYWWKYIKPVVLTIMWSSVKFSLSLLEERKAKM